MYLLTATLQLLFVFVVSYCGLSKKRGAMSVSNVLSDFSVRDSSSYHPCKSNEVEFSNGKCLHTDIYLYLHACIHVYVYVLVIVGF